MKKIISLALVFLMIFSVMIFAEENTEAKEVLSLIKDRIPDTEGFSNFESVRRQSGNITTFTFIWYTGGEDYKEMSVRATKSGIILSYNYYEDKKTDNRPSVNKPETKEFLDEAKKWSKKLNPAISDKIEVTVQNTTESLYGNEYYYKLTHMENSIPVYGNTGTLTLGADGKTLKSYYLTFDEGAEYQNPENIIGIEAAKAAFHSEIGMEAAYRTEYDNKVKKAYLSYMPKISYGTYIDAFTGKAIKPGAYEDGALKVENSASGDMVMDKETASDRFTAAELEEFDKLAELLSKDEAEKIIKDLGILRENDLSAEDFYTNRDYYDEETYYHNLTYRAEDYYASLRINAKSGKIMSIYQRDYFDKDDKEISKDEAQKAMDSTVSLLSDEDIKGEYRLKENEDAFSRSYKRYVNDILVEDDSIYIEISKKDGKIVSYSYEKSEMEFPSPEGIISEKEAAYKLIEGKEYKPFYYITKNRETGEITTNLIYMFLEGPYEIDAFTGDIVNPYKSVEIPEYKDIKGHFAENAIKTLSRFGIGFEEENFRPDEDITQKEYLTLLDMAIIRHQGVIITKDYNAERVYSDIFSRQILDKSEIDENAPVTRINSAIYFIRALDLDEIAEIKGIYACPFNDVTEKEGYATLLYGMNVMKGDVLGNFNPQRNITKAEAMVMIYNYLSK